MEAARFRSLIDAEGPFASVYVDNSHDTADAQKQAELRWRAIAEDLNTQGADTELIDGVWRVLREQPAAVGRGGLGVIVDHNVHVVEQLIRPPEQPTARVSKLPFLIPAIVHGRNRTPYLVVAVDHQGADIAVRTVNRSEELRVDGAGYPVHKARSADTPGYGDPQRTADGARAKNMQQIADRVVTIVDDTAPEVVFVVGEVSSRTDLLGALPDRVSAKVTEINAGARGSIDGATLQHEIETTLQLRRAAVIDAAAEVFVAERERGSGLATEGLAGVCAALREGAVETLIIGDIGDETVLMGDSPTMVAPNADVLSELGAGQSSTVRADEGLPFAALSIDAALVGMDERLTPEDGVAAILRYAPRSAAGR